MHSVHQPGVPIADDTITRCATSYTPVSRFGTIVDVFGAFGGAGVPNPKICTYNWMCTAPPLGPDIHATDLGYSVIADTFAAAILKD